MNFTLLERHICWCAHTSFNWYTLKFSSGPWSVYSEFIWNTFGLSNRTGLTSIPSVHHEGKDKKILQNPPGTGDMRGWLQRPSVTSHHRNICVTSNIVQRLGVLCDHTYDRTCKGALLSSLPALPPHHHLPLILYTGKEVTLYSLLLKQSCNLHSSCWNSYIPHRSPFETVQL